jgi:hypothetical protein
MFQFRHNPRSIRSCVAVSFNGCRLFRALPNWFIICIEEGNLKNALNISVIILSWQCREVYVCRISLIVIERRSYSVLISQIKMSGSADVKKISSHHLWLVSFLFGTSNIALTNATQGWICWESHSTLLVLNCNVQITALLQHAEEIQYNQWVWI